MKSRGARRILRFPPNTVMTSLFYLYGNKTPFNVLAELIKDFYVFFVFFLFLCCKQIMGFLKCLNYNVRALLKKMYNAIKEVSLLLSVNHKRRKQKKGNWFTAEEKKLPEIFRKKENAWKRNGNEENSKFFLINNIKKSIRLSLLCTTLTRL